MLRIAAAASSASLLEELNKHVHLCLIPFLFLLVLWPSPSPRSPSGSQAPIFGGFAIDWGRL